MRPLTRIILFRLFPFLLLAALIIGTERFVDKINRSVIEPVDKPYILLYIPTGAHLEQVLDSLKKKNAVRHPDLLKQVMVMKHYDRHIKSGCYRLKKGMSAGEVTDILIRGLQTPVKVSFHGIRKPEELAQTVARQLEPDSLSLIRILQNDSLLKSYGVTPATLFVLMIPNTYEMWWNSSASRFLERMASESAAFWKGQRTKQAEAIGLTRTEVVTLASVVEKETAKTDEKPLIAGVYINRLNNGWPLQADPTLIFAWDDYTIKRVLNRHKTIDSPYNTYRHTGLPPGPICIPSISSIDAVLNYSQHGYYYFCARDDFSGYHDFATTLTEHNRNAAKYRKALMRIRDRN